MAEEEEVTAAVERTLEITPTWAVATVCFFLILISILIEQLLHLIGKYFTKKRRKPLIQALDKIKSELMLLGFLSLLLNVSERPIARTCIPKSVSETFLPCKNLTASDAVEETKCSEQGKVSLLSRGGVQELQYLIFMLAVFHIFSCILTFSLGMAKMNRWESWEAETRSFEYQFSNDPRRFQLTHQTSFGKRHLKFWSDHRFLRWPACFLRQFYISVYKVDYFILRHGFITAHFAEGSNFDFQKYIRRALEKDFGVVVGISWWIWIFTVFFLFFNAHVFHSYLWLPFFPLVMLLLVGTKLQGIITKMCLDSHEKSQVVRGTVLVRPSDHFFWFGCPKLLLHLIHFILFQMGTSMRSDVFTEDVVRGLKRWRIKAKKKVALRNTNYSASPSQLDASHEPSFSTLEGTVVSVESGRPSDVDQYVAVGVEDEENVRGRSQPEEKQKMGSFHGFDLSNTS
ncbi:MLO-like protein 12 isoform X2 [Alnus glutinosa]|uniref:MLO-like protein 12 isoform X2 n=1 Tax=Alnus glutinosa TaxID=3517 RepID=UPI002D7664FD|nr:MLO-like protein 12 isoform X2 [Alnus glutinosa]